MKTRPIRIDPNAASAREGEPAFAARPTGAPAYHGFPVLSDIEVDGFVLGEITGFEGQEDGDAFVVAPDGSRAGLVWALGDRASVEGRAFPGAAVTGRWGVYHVTFPRPFDSPEAYRQNLADIVPRLREEWQRALDGGTWTAPVTAESTLRDNGMQPE
jgi:hypothetical protein